MRTLELQNKKFQEAIDKLNPEQKKAVETIEGPVLVIAGPGTGKTQILAARIGKILSETDVSGQNILCLTYTDAGTIAMRKRLFEFIGAEAYKVNIFTFHSFCNEIIQNDPEKFSWYELNPISDLESIELFQKLINKIPSKHKLKRHTGKVYFDLKNFRNLFSFIKKSSLTIEELKNKADEYIKEIEDSEIDSIYYSEYKYKKKYKESNPGDFKPSYFAEKDKIEKLKLAADFFPEYVQMMTEKGYYDFDDMVLWVIKAFKENPDFLQMYQEKYQYILVDEYQDTSQSQNQLIDLLSNYWEVPNVFVVGDDDQSIYGFQGAHIENMESFKKKHANNLELIVLTNNYRSTQNVLDASHKLIELNKERLVNTMEGLSKDLISKTFPSEIKPEIHEFKSTHQEFAEIANRVKDLLEKEFNPAEIAIIYKEHKIGNELADYFLKKDIPIQAKKKLNILELPLIKKIIKILQFINAEIEKPSSGDGFLFEILHYSNFNISPYAIATMLWKLKDFNKDGKEKYFGLRDYINKEFVKKSEAENTPEKRAICILENLFSVYYKRTIQELLEKIIRDTGILKEIFQAKDKNFQLEVISSFFNFLKQECQINPELDLEGFLSKIDLLRKNELSIEITQNIFNHNGVQFLTCHSSKGLEFEYVFLIGANKEYWEGKRKPNSGFKIPPNIINDDHVEEPLEELRRLFYVVMTRAKKHLYLSYSEQNKEGKLLNRSQFIGELVDQEFLEFKNIQVDNLQLEEYLELQFKEEEEQTKVSLIDPVFIDKFLENYSLSVTHLNNYLKCPLKFYFQNLISVPGAKNSSMVFGSAVHYALQKFFTEMKLSADKIFPSENILIEAFEWYLKRHREGFTKEEYQRHLDYGKDFLPQYLSTYINKWEKNVEIEKRITHVNLEGVSVNGILDKIEFKKDFVNISDYKTGKLKYTKEKLLGPNEKNPLGGDYWRQAVFYKLMIEADVMNNWKVNSINFDFVEPDLDDGKFYKKEIIISQEDEKIVRNQIKEVYQKIQNHEFADGCGKTDCEWCNFVRENGEN